MQTHCFLLMLLHIKSDKVENHGFYCEAAKGNAMHLSPTKENKSNFLQFISVDIF